MAVVTLVSAAGAPGVSTSALALALAWPRPTLLVEADPVGGSPVLSGWMHGEVPHDRGLVDLAMAYRQGHLADSLAPTTIEIPESSVRLVPGARSHQQAVSAAPVWEPLAGMFRTLERTGTDVVIDGGRLGMNGSPLPLVRGADLALLTTRSDLPALVAARGWVRELRDEFTDWGLVDQLGLLIVGPGRPYAAGEIGRTLDAPVITTLAWDPASAEVYHTGAVPGRRFAQAPLQQSIRAAASALHARIARNRGRLAQGSLVTEGVG